MELSVKAVSSLVETYPDYLPDEVIRENGLMSRGQSLLQMHFPENEEKLKSAIKRVALDEFLGFLIGIRRLKEEIVKEERKTMEMKEFRNGISDWTEYDVTLTYDDEGYVCDIDIETMEQE